MKLEDLAEKIGAGSIGAALTALVAGLWRWGQSREERIAAETKAHADVERERVRTTGETRVAELRAEQDTGRFLARAAEKAEERNFRLTQGMMEKMAELENQKAENDALRREVAFRDEVIENQSALLKRAHDTIETLTEALEASQRAIAGAHEVLRDITDSIARTIKTEPPPAPAE